MVSISRRSFRLAPFRAVLVGGLIFISQAGGTEVDPALARLEAILVPARPMPVSQGDAEPEVSQGPRGISDTPDPDMRGAMPSMMRVKRGLRDWIETRLTEFPENGDERALANGLNEDLSRADLHCESPAHPSEDRCHPTKWDFDGTGFVSEIRIDRMAWGRVLVVRTGLGILCGSDESAYAYIRRDGRWERFWQTEEAIAPGKPYHPQHIDSVGVSEPDDSSGARLVLALGNETWCSSTFYNVYWRLWHAGGPAPRILVDDAHLAWLGRHELPITGIVTKDDALIEFTTVSLDVAVHHYETLRHYRVIGDAAERVDPVALGPRAFVEDWLGTDSRESTEWGAPNKAGALKAWHDRLTAPYLSGEYLGDSSHCVDRSDQWQVGVSLGKPDESRQDVYFRLRWRPPYHFEMIDIAEKPWAACTERDPAADDDRTLFAGWQ